MSKPVKNIEKILLGVAVVAAAAFGFLGFKKAGAAEQEFSAQPPGKGKNDASVPGAQKVPAALASLKADRVYDQAATEAGREIDSFVGVQLFARRESPNDPVDLVNDADVHKGIPNKWWLEHHVSPNFADSPQRDDDGDGFSNLEEYEEGTHPGDAKEHPALLAKLSYIKDESLDWIVEYGFFSAEKWIPEYKDGTNAKNRVEFDAGLEVGELFFAEPPMAKRFKFIGVEEREVKNERLNITEKLKFAIYEDQKPNKKGIKYEIPERFPKAQMADHVQWDRTAVLDLQALGLAGTEFKVEEMTHFALPPSAEEKSYFLKSVTPEAIEVEYGPKDARKSVTIPKGGLPEMPKTR